MPVRRRRLAGRESGSAPSCADETGFIDQIDTLWAQRSRIRPDVTGHVGDVLGDGLAALTLDPTPLASSTPGTP